MSKVLITGDWHLRKNDQVWSRMPELTGDAEWGVVQLVRIVESDVDITNMLVLGDTFEGKILTADAIKVYRRFMDEMEKHHCYVHFVQGQHELSDPPLMSAIHAWPKHIHKERVSVGRWEVYGLDYQRPQFVRDELRQVPACDILATHQVWCDFMGEDRGDCWWSDVPAHVKTIATGDFHEARVSQSRGRQVISPGPLCMQKINETGDKCVFILNDDGTVKKQELSRRPFVEMSITSQADLNKFVENWPPNPVPEEYSIPEHIAKPLLRIKYMASIPDARERIIAAVGDTAHLDADPFGSETSEVTVENQKRHEAVAAGGLGACIREFYAGEPEVLATALRLWESAAYEDELKQIYTELTEDKKIEVQEAVS
jgi:hypothetical protein